MNPRWPPHSGRALPASPLRRGRWNASTREERLAYRLLAPVLGAVVVIATLPFLIAVWDSLQGRADEFTMKAPGDRKRVLGEVLSVVPVRLLS